MSLLTIHPESQPQLAEIMTDPDAIASSLSQLGVTFERWAADQPIPPEALQDEILQAYRKPVARLKAAHGFQSADVISVDVTHPHRAELRANFLNEHIHSDFEVRFFVEGRGLFYLHPDERVYVVLCEKGDLISVPAGVKHWFDMGANPHLKCIRLFSSPQGWVADFTGDDISRRFPDFETYLAAYA
jgi:1,2-dihydroxy-3-keto-5-methylthiopentene dioxygenase